MHPACSRNTCRFAMPLVLCACLLVTLEGGAQISEGFR